MSWYVAIRDFIHEFDEFLTDTDVSSPLTELEIWLYLCKNPRPLILEIDIVLVLIHFILIFM